MVEFKVSLLEERKHCFRRPSDSVGFKGGDER
jgi:hypothetical protein